MPALTDAELVLLACAALVAAFVFGFVAGTGAERSAWTTRADGDTPHHCDGDFYAVFTESHFLDTYRRRDPPREDVDEVPARPGD